MSGGADSSELLALARDIRLAREELGHEIEQVVKKGADNIKKDWKARWAGLRGGQAKHLPNAVNYDVDEPGLEVSAEIGVDKTRPQGPIGTWLEYGSVNNAPRPAGGPALDAEAPRFEQAMGDMAERLLSRRR